MRLSQLLAGLPSCRRYVKLGSSVQFSTDEELCQELDPDIAKITSDSRQVERASLFVAYRGVSVDGHRFVPDAIERGAVAVVCEEAGLVLGQLDLQRFVDASLVLVVVPSGREALAYLSAALCGFPARVLTMVGITGTDGKTSTVHFLYEMLRAAKKKVSMISTVGVVIGDIVLETGLHTTTPDAPEVQHYLAQMARVGTEYCLLEATSHGLAQHRVTACDFDVAIITNITHEHLDLHGSIENYRAAKALLFDSLSTAAPKGVPKTGVLNCDDSSFEYLKGRLEAVGTAWVGYSIGNHAEASLIADTIRCRPDKTIFTVRGRGYAFEAETLVVGDHFVSNCMAAAAAALEVFGLSPQEVQQGMAAMPGVPGRMERIDEGQPFTAIVDFAHTPNALRRSLTVARQLTKGRVLAVFGCAGLRDVQKREMMGHVAAELADVTIITAEDPRTEDLGGIIQATAAAMLSDGAVEGKTFERVPDRGRAIHRAVELAQPGDIVLALGKGHEQSMCFGDVEYPWDDRRAMRSSLQGTPILTLPTA